MQNKILGVIVGFGGFMLGGGMTNSHVPEKMILGFFIAIGSIIAGITIYDSKNEKKGTK
jgi:hypothetical protein